MKNEKVKIKKMNIVQLSRDMRFSREIHGILTKMDNAYQAYCEWGVYPENNDNINEENYHYKREEKLKEAKELVQGHYHKSLRRIVNTLKLEIFSELEYLYDENGNFGLYEIDNWDELEGLSEEESIEKYIKMRFEVPLEVLREGSSRYYVEICDFIKYAILELDKARDILKENVNIISRQVIPHKFIFGISDEENLLFGDESALSAFDIMVYSAVISILYEVEQQVLQEFEEGIVAPDTKETVSYLSKSGKDVFDNILRNMTIYITVQKVFNMLSGRNDKMPSTKVKEAIKSTFERLSRIAVKENEPQSLRTRYRNARGDVRLLSVNKTEGLRINSRKRNYALYLQEVPPLYGLAKNKGKLSEVDISLLDAPLENSVENIALKGYLLRQIVLARSMRKKEVIISYKNLYRSIGIKDSGRGMSIEEQNKIHIAQLNIRLKVKKCLVFWKEHELIRRADTTSTKKAVVYI